MAKHSIELNYEREDLRDSSKYIEYEYHGINPRKFFRHLKKNLENVRSDSGYKYKTIGGDSSFSIKNESLGESTGTVKGRLAAYSDTYQLGQGEITFKPYGPFGVWAMLVGIVLAFPTAFLSLILTGIGWYYHRKEKQGEVAYCGQDMIRILISGEATERTIEHGQEQVTDVFADMDTIFASNIYAQINESEFASYDRPHQIAIANQLSEWYNEIYSNSNKNKYTHFTFKSGQEIWEHVNEIQAELNQNSETRDKLLGKVLNDTPANSQDTIEEHQNIFMSELEEIADHMNIYVENEGVAAKQ